MLPAFFIQSLWEALCSVVLAWVLLVIFRHWHKHFKILIKHTRSYLNVWKVLRGSFKIVEGPLHKAGALFTCVGCCISTSHRPCCVLWTLSLWSLDVVLICLFLINICKLSIKSDHFSFEVSALVEVEEVGMHSSFLGVDDGHDIR